MVNRIWDLIIERMKAKEMMDSDKAYISVPKMVIIETENPGAESGPI